MTNKEKALELSKFYALLAKNDNGFTFRERISVNGPNMNTADNISSNYKVNPRKPVLKLIPLPMMVNSSVDMQFGSGGVWFVDNLKSITSQNAYETSLGNLVSKCRIRQDHPHANVWYKCPLPDGLLVSITYNDGGVSGVIRNYTQIDWEKVAYFYVYGVADGWRYAWEENIKRG